jgi:hypothetical protein
VPRNTSQCASVASYDYIPSSQIPITLMMEALSSYKFLQEPHGATSQKTPFFLIVFHLQFLTLKWDVR